MEFDLQFDLDYNRKETRNKIIKIVLKTLLWLLILSAAVFAAWYLTTYCVERTVMVGKAMEGTLSDGDKVLINLTSYQKDDPERFDVIVFKRDGKEHSYYYIRRVIGLPGETVQIIDGYVYINGEKLDEPIETEKMNADGLARNQIVLDEDEFFVLGDNRNSSEDSRFTSMGNVAREEIVGKAWIKTNGFSFISTLNKKSK